MSFKKILNKKTIIGLVVVALLITVSIGAGTFAFWRINITNEENVIHNGQIAVSLMENAEFDQNIVLENLYPSNIHYEEREIYVENTGSMEIKYSLSFKTDNEDQTIFENVLVSFDQGENWEYMNVATYQQEVPVLVGGSELISIYFRLSPEFDNLEYMDVATTFTVSLTAVQWEDTLLS